MTDTLAINNYLIVIGRTTEFEVHSAECADGAKAERDGFATYLSEGVNAEDAVAEEVAGYQANEQDFVASDFRILPCAKKVEG